MTDTEELFIQFDHLQTDFARFLFVSLSFHFIGRQNHVTDDFPMWMWIEKGFNNLSTGS